MRFLLIAAFLLLTTTLDAQYYEEASWRDSEALPSWVRMMTSRPVNVLDVDRAFRAWHEGKVVEKNQYTQYYRRWRRWADAYVQGDGTLRLPSTEERRSLARQLRAKHDLLTGAPAGAWRFLGPSATYSYGSSSSKVTWQTNVYCLDQSVSHPDILFAGGETGGIFKSEDRGRSWKQVSRDILHGSIRPVVIHPANPRTVYAGLRGSIVRSRDGGESWQSVYEEENFWAHDMLVLPEVPEVVIAASRTGLIRSSDAGASWQKIFPEQCWSLAVRPGDSRTVYTVRDSLSSSVFCVSRDAGETFTSRVNGWWQPREHQQTYGVRLTVSAAAPGTIYALIGASAAEPNDLYNFAGVFVSTDDGGNWRNTHPGGKIGIPYSVPEHTNLSAADGLTGLSQGFYDFAIIANPDNERELVAGGTSWWRSSNAGATWERLGGYVQGLPYAHPDMQWLTARSGELWICSDGGINYSTDFARTHEARMDGIAGSDFWGFDAGWNEDVLVGGRYHNGNTAWFEKYPAGEFLRMGGGEAATGYVNPGDNSRVYFSDIGGRTLPGSRHESAGSFPVGRWPNESYYYTEFSAMEFDPRCWNVVYIGSGNGLWKSTNGGGSFSLVEEFVFGEDSAAWVEHIAIPRSNPDVLYITQRSNTVYDGRILRSTDAGEGWTVCAQMPGTSRQERRLMSITCEADDPLVIWVALRAAAPQRNVFRSTDGGQSWENRSVDLPDGVRIHDIVHQIGTEGGVYLATNRGIVYYRNDTMSAWAEHGSGLPLSLSARKAKIFYRDAALRLGSSMGIWESPLYEASVPVAQISVDKLNSSCPRDTLFFEDHSVLARDSQTRWQWSFPGAVYVSSETARNPRVLYPGDGSYDVTLTVSNARGSSTQTLRKLVRVEGNDCTPEEVPGSAAVFGGNDNPSVVQIPPLGVRTRSWTFTAWVKPDGMQASFASIVSGNRVEINIDGDNELKYYWPPNGQWSVGSGLRIPPGKWSHVALAVAADSITLYVNGVGWTRRHTNDTVRFSDPLRVGNYNGWSSRHFKGWMDEICIYRRTLTQEEIRASMHLTRTGDEEGLLTYYQFNEKEGPFYDRIGVAHAAGVGAVLRVPVNGPFGAGVSQRLRVGGPGAHRFDSCGVTMHFPALGVLPEGELVCSRLRILPDSRPGALQEPAGYWIIDNYGMQPFFTALDRIDLDGMIDVRVADAGEPGVFSLWRRDPNAADTTWTLLGRAGAARSGQPGSVTLQVGNGIEQGGQLLLLRDGSPVSARDLPPAPVRTAVYPTALRAGQRITVHPPPGENVVFLLHASDGRLVYRARVSSPRAISTHGLPAGSYLYWIRGKENMTSGRIMLE